MQFCAADYLDYFIEQSYWCDSDRAMG